MNGTPLPPNSSKAQVWKAMVATGLREPAEDLQGCKGDTKTRLLAWDILLREVSFTNCKTSGKGNWATPVLFATVKVNF